MYGVTITLKETVGNRIILIILFAMVIFSKGKKKKVVQN